MSAFAGIIAGLISLLPLPLPPERLLHRAAERARGHHQLRPGGEARGALDDRASHRRGTERRRALAVLLSPAPDRGPGRTVLEAPVAESAQGGRRHLDHQRRLRPRGPGGEPGEHDAGSGHQGPAQHRHHGTAPVQGVGAQRLRVSLRGEEPGGARDGLFHLDPARAHRELRGQEGSRRRCCRRCAALTDVARVEGISINDLRKNLNDINQQMDQECQSSAARYGIVLDASLITGIDPPPGHRIRARRHQYRPQRGLGAR